VATGLNMLHPKPNLQTITSHSSYVNSVCVHASLFRYCNNVKVRKPQRSIHRATLIFRSTLKGCGIQQFPGIRWPCLGNCCGPYCGHALQADKDIPNIQCLQFLYLQCLSYQHIILKTTTNMSQLASWHLWRPIPSLTLFFTYHGQLSELVHEPNTFGVQHKYSTCAGSSPRPLSCIAKLTGGGNVNPPNLS
jgi:hypothetical protein